MGKAHRLFSYLLTKHLKKKNDSWIWKLLIECVWTVFKNTEFDGILGLHFSIKYFQKYWDSFAFYEFHFSSFLLSSFRNVSPNWLHHFEMTKKRRILSIVIIQHSEWSRREHTVVLPVCVYVFVEFFSHFLRQKLQTHCNGMQSIYHMNSLQNFFVDLTLSFYRYFVVYSVSPWLTHLKVYKFYRKHFFSLSFLMENCWTTRVQAWRND